MGKEAGWTATLGPECGEPCMSHRKSTCVMLSLALIQIHHICHIKKRNLNLVDKNAIFIG